MATKTSRNAGIELSVSLFDNFGEFICSKGSCSICYRVDWCINHCLQSNQFVEDEEKEKDGKNRGLTNFHA